MEVTIENLLNIIELLAKQKSLVTFQFLSEQYLKLYAIPRKKSWQEDDRYIHMWFLPEFAPLLLNEIDRVKVETIFLKMSQAAPVAANRGLNVLRKMFNLAMEWGYFSGRNPALGIKKNKEKPRERFLSEAELAKLREVLSELNSHTRLAIEFILQTGMRRGEVKNLRWCDLSFERKEILLSNTKNGETHSIPMTSKAEEILKRVTKESEYVFSYYGRKIGLEKSWRKIREKAGIRDVTIHDLRRTVGSLLAQRGCSLPLIGEVLNHKSEKSTSIYARFSKENVRSALEQLP